MPYTTTVAGTTITASWANANVRDQVVTPFATAAARDSAITAPVEGMLCYQADTDTLNVYNGAAWVQIAYGATAGTYTPTLTQSVGVTKTVDYAKYIRQGPFVTLMVGLSITGAGSANNAITVSLPITGTTPSTNAIFGSGLMRLVAGGNYSLLVQYQSTTTVSFLRTDIQPANVFGVDPNFALASPQVLNFVCTYEAA